MTTGVYDRPKVQCDQCDRLIAYNQIKIHQRSHLEPQRHYKLQPTTINKMNHLEIGWIAGIIEGEGCFWSKDRTVQIRVTMTDLDIIQRLKDVTGIGNITTWHRNGKEPNRKDAYNWVVTKRNDVLHLLCSIVPLMGERRKEQITKLLTCGGF